jgi:hypothetical protein
MVLAQRVSLISKKYGMLLPAQKIGNRQKNAIFSSMRSEYAQAKNIVGVHSVFISKH